MNFEFIIFCIFGFILFFSFVMLCDIIIEEALNLWERIKKWQK